MPNKHYFSVKNFCLKVSAVLVLLALIAIPIGCKISGLYGMFQPHAYNWRTGMPSLQDQTIKFQQVNKRWPTNYNDLVVFMKQTITNFIPESYDRIDFTTKPEGNLEILVYVANTGFTNHMTLKTSSK